MPDASRESRATGLPSGFNVTTTAAGAAQQLFWFMRQAVGRIDTSTFTARLTDPKTVSALETLQELYDVGQMAMPILSGGFSQGRMPCSTVILNKCRP